MRVLFIADPGAFDTPAGEHYEAGQVYDLTPDRAYKWITVLGIAVESRLPAEAAAPDPIAALQDVADAAAAETHSP